MSLALLPAVILCITILLRQVGLLLRGTPSSTGDRYLEGCCCYFCPEYLLISILYCFCPLHFYTSTSSRPNYNTSMPSFLSKTVISIIRNLFFLCPTSPLQPYLYFRKSFTHINEFSKNPTPDTSKATMVLENSASTKSRTDSIFWVCWLCKRNVM